jgi:serine/threonine protein kinase
MSTPAPAERAGPPPAVTARTLLDEELGGEGAVAAERSPPPDRSLGRYRIVRELGRGGMGVVLEAYDPTLDRRVALKILSRELGERQAKRQLREAQALARLSHPNVVGVCEVGTAEDQPYIAMELVEGPTLRQWHRTPRPWRALLDAYLQAGRGLAAAHAEGLVHQRPRRATGRGPRKCRPPRGIHRAPSWSG